MIGDYDQIHIDFGLNYTNAQLLKRMAELHAFYLDEKETAIDLLGRLTPIRNVNKELLAEAKLVLGDIYILKNEPWEAILIYAQVHKENEYSPIAHLAKFKEAKHFFLSGSAMWAKQLARGSSVQRKTQTWFDTETKAVYSLHLFQNHSLMSNQSAAKYAFFSLVP